MRHIYATPPAFPSVGSASPGQAALEQEARRLLSDAVGCVPVTVLVDPQARRAIFAPAMARLAVEARLLDVPVEHLIIAVKEAWAALAHVRGRLDDAAPEVLASAITVCIEQYFAGPARKS